MRNHFQIQARGLNYRGDTVAINYQVISSSSAYAKAHALKKARLDGLKQAHISRAREVLA